MNLLHFGAMISDFIGRYPDVRLELDLTTRHVDLAAGSYDVAIRAAAQLPKGAPELTRKMPACDEHAKKAGAKARR